MRAHALHDHPAYAALTNLPNLRVFMANHVFAVWDFMSLLKELQRRLTCVEVPWVPPRDPVAARMINEIVLAEETDEIRPGEYVAHFDLYLRAMRELGVDTGPIMSFVDAVRAGVPIDSALAAARVPACTQRFVMGTVDLLRRPTHELAAAFLLGREQLVPEMFTRILATLERSGVQGDTFVLYLRRHIELDGEHHGQLAERLLTAVCGNDARLRAEAASCAEQALAARARLWDGVLAAMQG